MSDFSWTAQRIADLRKHIAEGLSFGRIASLLGCSRSACVGKAHRLGIRRGLQPREARRATHAPARAARKKAHGPKRKPGPDAAVSKPPGCLSPPLSSTEEASGSRMLTLMELRGGLCKWPIGDPRDPAFRFCGADAGIGRTYCTAHRQIAYVPSPNTRGLT